jgi:hypothetical protein
MFFSFIVQIPSSCVLPGILPVQTVAGQMATFLLASIFTGIFLLAKSLKETPET